MNNEQSLYDKLMNIIENDESVYLLKHDFKSLLYGLISDGISFWDSEWDNRIIEQIVDLKDMQESKNNPNKAMLKQAIITIVEKEFG
jgi:hypothetical protein